MSVWETEQENSLCSVQAKHFSALQWSAHTHTERVRDVYEFQTSVIPVRCSDFMRFVVTIGSAETQHRSLSLKCTQAVKKTLARDDPITTWADVQAAVSKCTKYVDIETLVH